MGGAHTSTAQDERDEERTPLLPESERSIKHQPTGPTKKATRLVAHNVVIVFMTLLTLAVVVVLCVFFGSM